MNFKLICRFEKIRFSFSSTAKLRGDIVNDSNCCNVTAREYRLALKQSRNSFVRIETNLGHAKRVVEDLKLR